MELQIARGENARVSCFEVVDRSDQPVLLQGNVKAIRKSLAAPNTQTSALLHK